MRLLTAVMQAGLVGTVVYLLIFLIREELEDRRWWKQERKALEAQTRWTR